MIKFNSDMKFDVSLTGKMSNKGADTFFMLIGFSVLLAVFGFVIKWCFLS